MGSSPMEAITMAPTRNAANMATTGNRSSRMSFIRLRSSSCHHQSDLFLRRSRGVDFSHNSSFVNHDQSIRQRRDLLQLRRHQQYGTTSIPKFHQLPVDELNCADINAARRLRHQQQLRRQFKFATDDQLLLISAGKGTSRKVRICRTHVEIPNHLLRARANAGIVKHDAATAGYGRLAIVDSQYRVLSKTGVQQKPTPMAVFRHMRYSQFLPIASAQRRDVLALELDAPAQPVSLHKSGKRFDQFRLSISLHTGNPDDLACTHREGNVMQATIH